MKKINKKNYEKIIELKKLHEKKDQEKMIENFLTSVLLDSLSHGTLNGDLGGASPLAAVPADLQVHCAVPHPVVVGQEDSPSNIVVQAPYRETQMLTQNMLRINEKKMFFSKKKISYL